MEDGCAPISSHSYMMRSAGTSWGAAAAGRSTNESFAAAAACAMPAAAASAMRMSESRASDRPEGQSTAAQTVVKSWDPKTPYLVELKKTMAKWVGSLEPLQLLQTIEKAYFELKPQYHTAPSFYFDVAGWFFQQAKTAGVRADRWIATGVRILTNVFEMELESPQMLRVAAYRLLEAEQLSLAIEILERVLRLRPKEPQSRRDLALALSRRAFELASASDVEMTDTNGGGGGADRKQTTTSADIQRSISLFLDVIVNPVEGRFREIELTVLTELNNMVVRAKKAGLCGDESAPSCLKDQVWAKIGRSADPSQSADWNVLFQPIDCDLRVSMAWDTDDTDQDLHVIEPNGEEVFYQHKLSKQGGAIGRDFTQGYGPEEYMVIHGRKGTYKIRAKYFASHRASLTGGTTLILSLFTNFGRANETCHISCVRLQSADQISTQDNVDIGEITLA